MLSRLTQIYLLFVSVGYSIFLTRLLNVSLQGKPVIIAQEGPVDGQVRCIAAGYPVPKISWYFCELPHTRYVDVSHLSIVRFSIICSLNM